MLSERRAPNGEVLLTTLELPQELDAEWVNLLSEKKHQYLERLKRKYGNRINYWPPEAWRSNYNGYGYLLISEVLETGLPIDTEALYEKLSKNEDKLFDKEGYNAANYQIGVYLTDKNKLRESVERVKQETNQLH